jgi:hypothetical protein
MKCIDVAISVFAASIAACGGQGSPSSGPVDVRRPVGIYAVVDIEDHIAEWNSDDPQSGASAPAALFGNLIDNDAVSGLTLRVQWATLNPVDTVYDWTYVDDAFDAVAAWNGAHGTLQGRTIQLIVTPGFGTPSWLLRKIPPCDGLFQTPPKTPASACGSARFLDSEAQGTHASWRQLPLPWNDVYQTAWRTFLLALASRYGREPTFVSIAVAGPTATTAEMILPSTATSPSTGLSELTMWRMLLAFHYPDAPSYLDSDQAFIDAWTTAIETYEEIFSGVTLVVTTGNGLPNFAQTGFTVPNGFTPDCTHPPDMDCAAETTILSRFVSPSKARTLEVNAKATQTSGLAASRAGFQLGIDGVKYLSEWTAGSSRVLGGAQLNGPFSVDPWQEGCPGNGCTASNIESFVSLAAFSPGEVGIRPLPSISPEQALYNVLADFFDGTALGPLYGASKGSAPLNYLQIYETDIEYATSHTRSQSPVLLSDGTTKTTSAQGELELASARLFEIAEP